VVPGTTEKDYYHGRVTQAVPEQEDRADDPAAAAAADAGADA
jgi:hypothetical protein